MRRTEIIMGVLIGLAVGWFYLWTALQPGTSWVVSSKDPQGYYPLETAGFRSGHLYAAIEPHPALLALGDPYDPVANAPYRVHDMSLYKGHYYLYFGVTPVLLLFWPVAVLTGRYVSEPFAVALFCSAAIWVGMGLLLAVRRRHFPRAPLAALLAGWVCLAWATPLTLLVEGPQFYQVPISCAIFLQALMLAAIYRSLHSPARALEWMSVAGLLFGLSVGARPNYLAGALVLLVPVFYFIRGKGADREERLRLLRKPVLYTFVPPAVCGLGLLAYNWARFGSLSEFGMHYQLAGERVTQLKAVSLVYLVPHVFFYLLNPGLWQSYFPFFSANAGQPYGFLHYVLWAWLAFAAFIRLGPEEPGERRGGREIAVALAGASLINLAFLSCFFGTTSRYPGDFANAGLILAGMGALTLGQRAVMAERSTFPGIALTVIAGASLFFSLAVYVGGFPRKDAFLGLARAANWPVYALQNARGARFGGLRLSLRLPEHPPDLAEPLFETGRQSDQRDWLEIEYLAANRARLSVFHAGTGAFEGREFFVPADRKIVVEARCGSLLPPYGHPLYATWSRSEFDAARRDLQITVNGTEVLRAALDCYESSPANTTIGRLAWFTGGMKQAFSGDILGVERLPLVKPAKAIPLFDKPTPVELSLFLPTAKSGGADPLLVTGEGTQSDLVYCVYEGANRVKFVIDHFGNGGPQSETVTYDPLVPHTLTLWMGSMAGPPRPGAPKGEASPDHLVVIFDGRTLLNIDQVFYPSSPQSAIVGFNAYGSTATGHEFTGRVTGVRQLSDDVLPKLVRTGSYGAVEMSVGFPFDVMGTQEPLVVTGVVGAGDFIYVRYIDARHLSIGYDHWSVGGIMGDPIEVDYGQTHRLAITFQALYPAGSPLHASDRVRVLLDGRVALDGKYASHPSTGETINIGKNTIGGSTCGPTFTGRILSVERFPEPRP